MTSHCAGTVQMREESESGIRKWEEMWFKMTAEDGEQWRVMEDCSTDEQLQQETLCHRQWTDEYVERPETLMRQNVVVVWIECLLVDVVRHAGTLALDHVGICTPKLGPYKWCAQKPSSSEVGKAAGWCDWTSTTRLSAWRLRWIPTEVAEEGTQECRSRKSQRNRALRLLFKANDLNRLIVKRCIKINLTVCKVIFNCKLQKKWGAGWY